MPDLNKAISNRRKIELLDMAKLTDGASLSKDMDDRSCIKIDGVIFVKSSNIYHQVLFVKDLVHEIRLLTSGKDESDCVDILYFAHKLGVGDLL